MKDFSNLVFMLMYGVMGAILLAEVVKRYPLHTPRRAFHAGFALGCLLFALKTIFL